MARCQWCTAPLPAGSVLCRYCGKRSDVDLRGVHEYTVAAPDATRLCPACGIPMQTLDLKLGGTFLIERCEKCLSLFFDPNEIETVLERSASEVFQVDRQRLSELDRGRGGGSAAVRYHPCPVCRTMMNRVNFGARSGVIIDQCPAHGMWLEGGELRRLLEWKQAGGQVHDQKRRAERLEEELKREQQRSRDEVRLQAEAGSYGGNDEPLLSLPDPTETVQKFVKVVLKLFR